MADIKIYPELSYGSWEYRQERLAWEDAYHSKARTTNWDNRYRNRNGSYSSKQILEFICDKTVNAEYRDYSSSPFYIRKYHTFPIPEFRITKNNIACPTFLKKKFINEHTESTNYRYYKRLSGTDYYTYVFECYPHNSDDWYEDYMNSTHNSEGVHQNDINCKNSRLLNGTGNKMIQDIIKNHGGHLNIKYEDYTSVLEIPRPYIEYNEIYTYNNPIPGFDRVFFGNPMRYRVFDKTTPARTPIDRIVYSAYNTDASYGKLSNLQDPSAKDISKQKFARTGTVKEAFDLLLICYKALRLDNDHFPDYLNIIYPEISSTVEDPKWTKIKDNPCSIFVGDSEHSIQHILDYLCYTFQMNATVENNNIVLKMGISESAYVQTINFGKNLLDYSSDVDLTDIVTAVCPYMVNVPNPDTEMVNDGGRVYILPGPYWHTRTLSEGTNCDNEDIKIDRTKYVFDEQLVSQYGWVTDVLEFDYNDWSKTVTYTTQDLNDKKIAIRNFLQEQANIFLKEQISKSIQSFDISAIDLAYMGEKDVPLHIGDLVRCVSAVHDLDITLAVTEIKIDFAHPEKTMYTLGNPSVKKSISHIVGKNIDKQG